MTVFESADFRDHEQVVFCSDEASGLRAIIAIHNTNRGPALGGCRMWPYDSEEAAITDVLRLSRGMTYKAAIVDLPLGGGKSVIIGDPKRDKSDALLAAMGRAIDRLGGRYITAEDVGTTVADMDAMRLETPHVRGVSGSSGDPSPVTAYGVFMGLCAAAAHRFGSDELAGLKVAVQGLGNVGYHLCKHLEDHGAELIVADMNEEAVERAVNVFGATAVSPDDIIDQDVDIFAPCALGGVINDDTIPRLKAAVVAGAANNQLAEDRHGKVLMERGILYAPDYAINAGGLINVFADGPGYNPILVMKQVEVIYQTLDKIFDRATADGLPTNTVADRIAEERFRTAAGEIREPARISATG